MGGQGSPPRAAGLRSRRGPRASQGRVNELAARLEIAPTTVSLMVGDLAKKGVLERVEDPADRRRKIVSIAPAHAAAIDGWLGRSANAWRSALAPLDAAQRRMFLETLGAYERGLSDPLD
ncbi:MULTISPECIES: MarR family winged helix-turn-helix transcriptional regulator [Streptomyces]|uniref:MarR family winged helix-turn-helix transcriptional regulator n=1 Tax=Streptomyces TaxID=1883 RepID=UPI003640A259